MLLYLLFAVLLVAECLFCMFSFFLSMKVICCRKKKKKKSLTTTRVRRKGVTGVTCQRWALTNQLETMNLTS